MKTFRQSLGRDEWAEFSATCRNTIVTVRRVTIDNEGMGIWTIPSIDEQARMILAAGYKASRSRVWRESFQWARRRDAFRATSTIFRQTEK